MKSHPQSSKTADLSEADRTQHGRTSGMRSASSLLLLVLILASAPTALASNPWYVDGVSGSDSNNCMSSQTACKTIGHAISLAASGDSIMVAAATYTENLSIGFSLEIVGSGANTTTIDGGRAGTVVSIPNAGVPVILSGVTIRHGSGAGGGGIYNVGTLTINNSTIRGNSALQGRKGTPYGGGIYNNGGALTINNSTISGNNGGVYGGGIVNYGAVTINNSSVIRNGASQSGGGIYNGGTLMINNSTISGNGVISEGGGIYNGGTLMINNSTISGNSAALGTGGISFFGFGPATLQNSIVANSSGANCYGSMTSNGYNLSSDGTCNFSNTGDLNNTDPRLGPLQKNGGPTPNQALLSGSPAIDAGNPSGCTDGQGHLLKTDQRGKPRPDKEDTGGCDMGAYESQQN